MRKVLLTFCTLLLAVGTRAQVSTVKIDNGVYSSRYTPTGRPLWEESVMLKPNGPCKVEKLYVYLVGTKAVQDTIWLAGDASEGFTPPSHYVWDYDLLTEPIVFQFSGKTGWDTIDISNRNVRSDGYDRIVFMHRIKAGYPSVGYDKDGVANPVASFLYDPWTPNANFYNIPGLLYLTNGDFMARLGVSYDFPSGDSSALPPPATLLDVTKQVGLTANGAIIQSDRVSVADWNGDGWDDVNIGSKFFQNKGDGTFKDVSSTINVAASSTVWGDFDNDGKLDMYAINGGAGDKLMRNNGDGTFTDVTAASGFSNPNPTVTPIWFDYDHDGYLDLYIANGRTEDASGEVYFPDQLWHNNRNGTFTNVTDAAHISDAEPDPYQDCWGATACDYNGDSWPDIFVANYRLAPDFLFKNQHDGTFAEVGEQTGVRGTPTVDPNYFGHGIGCDWGDFNNDGLVDLVVGNLGHPDERGLASNPSLIFKNNGAPDYTFTEQHVAMGLKFREMNSGVVWLDLNNDGYLDLWHCQYSYVNAGDTSSKPLVEQYRFSRMYLNEGPSKNFHLKDITWNVGSLIHGAWTAARSDFDHDGRMDLIVASGKQNEGVKLFKNNLPNTGNWIEFRLKGDPQHKISMDAYGTSITLYVNGMKIYRDLMGGGSGATGTQNTSMYHFGIGSATVIDSAVIRYPNNEHRTLYNVAANTLYDIPYEEAKNFVPRPLNTADFEISNVSVEGNVCKVSLASAEPLTDVVIEVFDMLGKSVAHDRFLNAAHRTMTLELDPGLANGVYVVQVESEHGLATQKVNVIR